MKVDKISGRGATHNKTGKFEKQQYEQVHLEGLDTLEEEKPRTQFLFEHPKTIINKVSSPDLPFEYSLNPYQGCEHGCSYCYARPTHEYWGYSAGRDFEQKIIVKRDLEAKILAELGQKNRKISPIILSGNTDCYQPAERKFELTRGILKLFNKYSHPIGIITKNNLITRDLDILADLASRNLVKVNISITTLDKQLRRFMEPRTSSPKNRLQTIEALSKAGVPVSVMMAPIIPGLNAQEIPELLKAASSAGARSASYTIVRLNGAVAQVFKDWIYKFYPNKATKVLNQIADCHGGEISSIDFKSRMKGQGEIAKSIKTLFNWAHQNHFKSAEPIKLNTEDFISPKTAQLSLKL